MSEVTLTSADALKNFPGSADAGKTTKLIIKSFQVDTGALATALAKCSESLEVLQLEKVTLPGKEPFKKRVTLPKLKTFVLSQVKAGVDSKSKLEEYLDGLDVKNLLFFDKKQKTDWDLENVWDLKVNISLIVDGWKILDVNHDENAFISMLPTTEDILKNSPKDLAKLALWDLEIEDDSSIPTSELTQLTLYETIFPDIPAVLKQCQALEELSMFEEKDEEETGKKGKDEDEDDDEFDDEEGEEEEEDGDNDDWNNLELADLPVKSLKRLALGRARLSAKVKGAVAGDLDHLALENCKADQESLKLLKAKRVLLRNCDPQPTATVLKRMTDTASTEFVMMNGFNWEAKDTNKKKMNELLKASSSSGELYSGEDKFLLEKAGAKWKGRKFEEDEVLQEQFKMFNWKVFCSEENWTKMFDD